MRPFYSILFFLMFGCTSAIKSPFDNGRLDHLSRQNKLRADKIEDNKIRTFISSEKKNRALVLKKSYPLPSELSEESLYSEVLNYYRLRSARGMSAMVHEFMQRYPNSSFADNALYLKGQLELESGQYTKALAIFDEVLKKYPTGNKYVSALLGKGIAYRKLQIYSFSRNTFYELKKRFPGSPEFYKAELEERLLEANL